MDIVATVPEQEWEDWLAEGDCAGDVPSGKEHGWKTDLRFLPDVEPGDRLYIVSHHRVRGFARVLRVDRTPDENGEGTIWRGSGAAAVTIPEAVRGFGGIRHRWWDPSDETYFPKWRTEGVS